MKIIVQSTTILATHTLVIEGHADMSIDDLVEAVMKHLEPKTRRPRWKPQRWVDPEYAVMRRLLEFFDDEDNWIDLHENDSISARAKEFLAGNLDFWRGSFTRESRKAVWQFPYSRLHDSALEKCERDAEAEVEAAHAV